MRSSLLVLCLVGCGGSRYLVHDSIVPDTEKVVRATLHVAPGEAGAPNSIGYSLQICDLIDGEARNCVTTQVLDHVTGVKLRQAGF